MKVFIVFEQTSLMTCVVVKVFREEQHAKDFCDQQNAVNKPEFDYWGYTEGIYHSYAGMELE